MEKLSGSGANGSVESTGEPGSSHVVGGAVFIESRARS